jgi:hypothetical protein
VAADKETLDAKTVDELRDMARQKGIDGASDMRKDGSATSTRLDKRRGER